MHWVGIYINYKTKRPSPRSKKKDDFFVVVVPELLY